MTKEFAWHCVILDDQLASVAGISGALTKFGLQCALGPPNDAERPAMASLGEHLACELMAADVVLIDMQWETVGRNGKDKDAVAILREGIRGSIERFKAWCVAHAFAERPRLSDPGDDQVGYVLGAAISQLNSHARLVFVSSLEPSKWSPIVTSLQFFEPAPYAISFKESVSTQIDDVKKALLGLQRLLVAQNREVRRWLIAQVLLPVSLGLPPQSGMCAEVWPDRDAHEEKHQPAP